VGIDVSDGALVTMSGVRVSKELLAGGYLSTAGLAIGVRADYSTVTVDASVELMIDGGDAYGVWLSSTPDVTAISSVSIYPLSSAGTVVGVKVVAGADAVLDGTSVVIGDVSGPRADHVVGVDLSAMGSTSLGQITTSLYGELETVGVRSDEGLVNVTGSISANARSGNATGVWVNEAGNSKIQADIGKLSALSGVAAEGVHVTGASLNVEISNGTIDVLGRGTARAVSFDSCYGAMPVVKKSSLRASITGMGSSAEAIHAQGGCNVRVFDNPNIEVAGGATGGEQTLTAISCSNAGGASACDIGYNPAIHVTGGTTIPGGAVNSVGIACDGCVRITENTVSGLSQVGCHSGCIYRGGGVYAGTTPLVQRNVISARCSGEGVGLSASGRVENNVIAGPTCGASNSDGSDSAGVGLAVSGTADVDSNTIHAGGIADIGIAPVGYNGCRGSGVELSGTGVRLRNNIVVGGSCFLNFAVAEETAGNAAATLTNNDLTSGSGVLYLDEGTTVVTTISSVNALVNALGNFSLDPLLTSDGHLQAGSPCIDAGVIDGAPVDDIDSETRTAIPDVGADEWFAASG